MLKRLKSGYVSELDSFLQDFDANHPEKSRNQQKEINKHARIASARDGLSKQGLDFCSEEKTIWQDF